MCDDYAYKVVADYYGYEQQRIKLIEECGELIQALAKDSLPSIIEEAADVANVLIQVAYLLDVNKLIDQMMGAKMDRQKERIIQHEL